MMKMATGDGFPLWQGAGMGVNWFSVATEASGGGTPDLLSSSKFLGYMGIYGRKKREASINLEAKAPKRGKGPPADNSAWDVDSSPNRRPRSKPLAAVPYPSSPVIPAAIHLVLVPLELRRPLRQL